MIRLVCYQWMKRRDTDLIETTASMFSHLITTNSISSTNETQRDFILFDNSSISAYSGTETSIKFRHVSQEFRCNIILIRNFEIT